MSAKKTWRVLFKASPIQVLITLLVMLGLLSGTFYYKHLKDNSSSREQETIRYAYTPEILNPVSDSQKIVLRSADRVSAHYHNNNDALIWISSEKGVPARHTYALIARIGNCYLEGLNPYNYHFEEIRTLLILLQKQPLSSMNKAVYSFFDVLLTDAYIAYTTDHYAGQVHSGIFNVDRQKHIEEINPMDSLAKLDEGKAMDEIFESFICPFPDYLKLQNALKLCYEGQNRDSATHENIRLISLNMERWRWLERKDTRNYLMANTADFTMKVM